MSRLSTTFKHSLRVLVLSALLLVLLAMSFGASRADAATLSPQTNAAHCSSLGNLIESDPFYDFNGARVGELDVYYNSSTGYNCAYTQSGGSLWGVAKYMAVGIWTCQQTAPNTGCTQISQSLPYFDGDSGTYSYYAGPAGVYGQGHCIYAYGEIGIPGGTSTAHTQQGHCG